MIEFERCKNTFLALDQLRNMNPPNAQLLGEDLETLKIRLMLIETNWHLLNSLEPDGQSSEIVVNEGDHSKDIENDSFEIAADRFFPKGAEISRNLRPALVASAVCTLISEIENVRQGCARVIIRQSGKEVNRSDGWGKLMDIISTSGFSLNDTDLPLVKRWKERSDEILKDKSDLSTLRNVRGMIQHGAVDRVMSLGPRFLLNKLVCPNEDGAISPIKYIDDRMKELEKFVTQFVGWVKSQGFLPDFPKI